MAGIIGTLEKFEISGAEPFAVYLERLDLFCEANGITEAAKKKAVFLSGVGVETYKLVRNLCTPQEPKSKTLTELTEMLKKHLAPDPNVILERFRFNKRDRKDGESVADYIAELRNLSRDCEYGDKLDEMIRDRLVCGIGDVSVQKKLLQAKDLDFPKAQKLALSAEASVKESKSLTHGSNSEMQLHKVDTTSGNQRTVCFRCGDMRHSSDSCLFKDRKCFSCDKIGHIARVCRQRQNASRKSEPSKTSADQKSNSGPSSHTRFRKPHNMRNVDHEDESHQSCSCTRNQCEESDEYQTESAGGLYNLYKCEVHHGGEETLHQEDVSERRNDHWVHRCEIQREDPIYATVQVNGVPVDLEVDTGASLTVMGDHKCKQALGDVQLRPTNIKLKTYSGEFIKPLGVIDVAVEQHGETVKLPLVVTPGDTPSLVGRNWLKVLKLDWAGIFGINKVDRVPQELESLLEKHKAVFEKGLGTFKDVRVKIEMQDGVEPKYMKARPVPYALKKDVEDELERLVSEGVYEPVAHSDWATPIVPVVEPGKIRICGDYKTTVNPRAKSDHYPVPKTEDLLATLNGGLQFTKLDLTGAYHQLMLHEDSRECLTINTHKGLLRPTRLVFGVHMASGVFQRHMEKRLDHVERTIARVDDILITGVNTKEHLQNLGKVLDIVEKNGLRLKKEKCKFFMDEVEFLGYSINAEGVKPIPEKVKAILNAPVPQNTGQVRSFLGMVQYYHRHLPNLATELEPLHKLLRKGAKWEWSTSQDAAFRLAKAKLTSENLLVHYNPELPIILHTDASPYGLGAVLSHVTADGAERPVAYASRTLSTHERNYAHIEKEGLAVVYAVKKLHQYLYGRKFEIYTDHKPLLGLLGEHKPVSETAAARIQRWALILSAYNYVLKYRQGRNNGNADALSRLPRYATHQEVSSDTNEIHMMTMDCAPVTAAEVSAMTRRDPVLGKIHDFVLQGWPEEFDADDEIKQFSKRKEELSVEAGVVLWGSRVVVPMKLRKRVLDELHVAHAGSSRMKMLARSFVWWPKMDGEIDEVTSTCWECVEHRKSPAAAPIHPWETPSGPWQRIHVDYAGPFMGRMFLIVSDAFSKWLDVHVTASSTSQVTIEKLRHTFSTHGVPEVLVSDNGPCFVGSEFKKFTHQNGIRHVTSAPYHPSTNGLAERSVQTFKTVMKKWKSDGGSIETRVDRFLFAYRNTPHSTTGLSPAELLMNRRPRTCLSIIKPNLASGHDKAGDKLRQVRQRKTRTFAVGQQVRAMTFGSGDKWIAGVIQEVTGPVSYKVKVSGGVLRRHADQILSDAGVVARESLVDIPDADEVQIDPVVDVTTESESNQSLLVRGTGDSVQGPLVGNPGTLEQAEASEVTEVPSPSNVMSRQPIQEVTPVTVRRSGRTTRKPGWMRDYTS